MKRTTLLLSTVICLLSIGLFTGCEPLRFAPTENQKITAELTYNLAQKVNTEGTASESPVTKKLCEGTRAAVLYIGRPKEPPAIEQFDTVAVSAQTDAIRRPEANDIFDTVEGGLSLAAQLAILFGMGGFGFGGKKLLDWLSLARKSSNALKEIVKGNELLKNQLIGGKDDAVIQAFKDSQKITQSSDTRVLVTKIKSE